MSQPIGLSVSQLSPDGLRVGSGSENPVSFTRIGDGGTEREWRVYVVQGGKKIPVRLSSDLASRVNACANKVLSAMPCLSSGQGRACIHPASRVVEYQQGDSRRCIHLADQGEGSALLEEEERIQALWQVNSLRGNFLRGDPNFVDDEANPLASLCRDPWAKSVGGFIGSREVSRACASVPLAEGESKEDLVKRVWVCQRALWGLIEEMEARGEPKDKEQAAYLRRAIPRIAMLSVLLAAPVGAGEEGEDFVQEAIEQDQHMKNVQEMLRAVTESLGHKGDPTHKKWMEAMFSGMLLQQFYASEGREDRALGRLIARAHAPGAVGYEELLRDVALLHFCRSEEELGGEDRFGAPYQRVNSAFDWKGSPPEGGGETEEDWSLAGRLRHYLQSAEAESAERTFDESRASDDNYLKERMFDRQSMRARLEEVLEIAREKWDRLMFGDTMRDRRGRG